jgi:predicted DNA-binding transcriptional regulator YafY
LNYSPEQLQSALKVLKSLVKNMDIEELLDMDEFLEKIGTYIKNTEFIDEVKQISYLKDIDKDILRELLQCCKDKNQIIVTYNSPNSGDKKMEILADKIDIINGKVYLCGINFEYKQDGIFLINRIKNIEEIKTETTMPKGIKETKVVYEVVNNPNYELESFEKVLEKDDKKLVIEATTTNNFLLRQRLLALGPNCTIISPEEFKTKFVELLKDMKAGYYCG